MSFLLWTEATTLSLSHTVGKVLFPIAACSELQAFKSKSNAFLCPKSTNAPCSSVLKSDITSSYSCLKDGVILPISHQFSNIVLPHFLPCTITDFGVFMYWCLTRVALKLGRNVRDEMFLRYTITFAICFRYVPPIGLGITPLLLRFESPVTTIEILFLAQALLIMDMTSLTVLAVSNLLSVLESLKNFVRL